MKVGRTSNNATEEDEEDTTMVEATVEEFHKVLVVRVPGPEGSGDREQGLGHGWG